jgi:hypothetical protein
MGGGGPGLSVIVSASAKIGAEEVMDDVEGVEVEKIGDEIEDEEEEKENACGNPRRSRVSAVDTLELESRVSD